MVVAMRLATARPLVAALQTFLRLQVDPGGKQPGLLDLKGETLMAGDDLHELV